VFYDPLLAALGLRLIKETDRIIAYGLTETVFSVERPIDGQRAIVGNGTYVAFHAERRKAVHGCYEIGLANGGTDDGAPAIRSTRTTTQRSYGIRTATRSDRHVRRRVNRRKLGPVGTASKLLSSWCKFPGTYNATYGSLGAVIGFMVCIHCADCGEINAEMEHQQRHDR
jgi:hypothetical protein